MLLPINELLAKDLLSNESILPTTQTIGISALNGQLIFSGEMEGSSYQLDLSSFQIAFYFIASSTKSHGLAIRRVKD